MREERERLAFNQADFAAMGGATRKTQYNYETGERAPDGGYLAAIALEGADVQYILTGIRSTIATESEHPLSPRQRALLDNYDNTDETGKGIIEATAFAAAKQKTVRNRA